MATYYVATTGNDTTGDGSEGNPFATPGKAAAVATSNGDVIWVKSGTYTLSTSTPGAGGPVVFASAVSVRMEGYAVTPGDRAGRPVLSAGAIESVVLFTGLSNGHQRFIHLEVDGNSKTGVSGFLLNNGRWQAYDCVARNCNQASAYGFNNISRTVSRCRAVSCTTGFACASASECVAESCGVGFYSATSMSIDRCVAVNGTTGFTASIGSKFVACTADGNSGDGFFIGSTGVGVFACIATNNGGYAFNTGFANLYPLLEQCASYVNTSGRLNNAATSDDFNKIELSDDPYINRAVGDYRPNDAAGGGALLRGQAEVAGLTDNRDIGAVQHADPAAGGGAINRGLMTGGRL